MTQLAKAYNTQFQLALGDNFYDDGVVNADDKRFKVSFPRKLWGFRGLKKILTLSKIIYKLYFYVL